MNRAYILALLREHRDEITTRFGATHLALFGSAARDELRPDSDVDLLVDFDEKWLRLFEQLSPIYKWTAGGCYKCRVVHGGVRRKRRTPPWHL